MSAATRTPCATLVHMAPDDRQTPVGLLATQLAAGDESALREAYHRWSRLIHTIARNSLGSAADADDVTQQVFIAAWNSRASLRASDEALPAWLIGICRIKVIDALRARSRGFRTEEAMMSEALDEHWPPSVTPGRRSSPWCTWKIRLMTTWPATSASRWVR